MKDAGGGSVFMSDANVRRLVAGLSRMRGAALKLGQFMSIQGKLFLYYFAPKPPSLGQSTGVILAAQKDADSRDNHMLPPELETVLQQVQAHANYMPDWQMEVSLTNSQ